MSSPQPLTRDDLFAQLRKVVEPCSVLMGNQTDICAMGLVEEVAFAAGHARVTLCLTDAGCIHFQGMKRYISDVLLELPGVVSVEVGITTEHLWTPDRIEHGDRAAKAISRR